MELIQSSDSSAMVLRRADRVVLDVGSAVAVSKEAHLRAYYTSTHIPTAHVHLGRRRAVQQDGVGHGEGAQVAVAMSAQAERKPQQLLQYCLTYTPVCGLRLTTGIQ